MGKSWFWKGNKALENYCKDFDIYAELSPESLEGSDLRGTWVKLMFSMTTLVSVIKGEQEKAGRQG